jgi:hypothetical protein
MIPKINNICDCCDSDQSILQLFNDQCFKIIDGADTKGSFCLSDFAFPSDGYSCLDLNLNVLNGETTLFDNEILTVGSPSITLTKGNLYARGILLKITYPVNDDNGEEILITDKNVELWIEDAATLIYKQLPLYNLFIMFTNPKSNDPSQLINRIKVVNPNDYKVKVTGLVIFGEAQ